mmetsp:Transcript_9216/g.16226  ORF Transcript_9216/g.16226 Transcript_9216/m.16226 type:complete len:125 (+) Transcript_9216:483-857(+)
MVQCCALTHNMVEPAMDCCCPKIVSRQYQKAANDNMVPKEHMCTFLHKPIFVLCCLACRRPQGWRKRVQTAPKRKTQPIIKIAKDPAKPRTFHFRWRMLYLAGNGALEDWRPGQKATEDSHWLP